MALYLEMPIIIKPMVTYNMNERFRKQLDYIIEIDKVKQIFRNPDWWGVERFIQK